jgi:hypothetical protein
VLGTVLAAGAVGAQEAPPPGAGDLFLHAERPGREGGSAGEVERGTHGALDEAMDALPEFREQLLGFLRTGEMAGIRERVQLPPVDWVVPAELPAAASGGRSSDGGR